MSCRFLLWSSHWRPLPLSSGTTFPGGTPKVSDLSCRFCLRVRISRQGTTNGTLNFIACTLFVCIKTAGNVFNILLTHAFFFLSLAPRVSALAALFMPHVCNDSVGLASSPVRITLHVPTASRASIPPRAPSSVCSVLQVDRYDLWDFHWCRAAQLVPWLWEKKKINKCCLPCLQEVTVPTAGWLSLASAHLVALQLRDRRLAAIAMTRCAEGLPPPGWACQRTGRARPRPAGRGRTETPQGRRVSSVQQVGIRTMFYDPEIIFIGLFVCLITILIHFHHVKSILSGADTKTDKNNSNNYWWKRVKVLHKNS